jgi:N-sulfoglucosamine sulfohydrolase
LPEHLQGQSFANLLRKKPHTPRTEIFAEKTFHTAYEPQRAIRTNRYKLIWNVEAGIINVPGDIMHSPIFPQMIKTITQERPHFELYDLSQDQQELNNLASNPEYAEVFHNLRQKLLDWMQKTDDPILKGPLASPFYYQGLEKLTESSP